MQSDDAVRLGGASPSPWPTFPLRPALVVFLAIVPLLGLFAEVVTGALGSWLSLFPTWWHVAFVLLAVVINLPLHLGAWRQPHHLVARAAAVGFVAGMALLYALVEAPALPIMVMLSWTGLGLLAAAPYFVCLGMLRLVLDLFACWRAAARPSHQLAVLLIALAVLPCGLTWWSVHHQRSAWRDLFALGQAMRDPALANTAEPLAASLRGGDLDAQRVVCALGRAGDDDGGPFGLGFDVDGVGRPGPFGHLATGRPFWFTHWRQRREVDPELVRMAFHRAHGCGWDDGGHRIPGIDWQGGARIEWLASKVTVRPEPDAALAQVDWELEVTSHRERADEARFDIRLPSGAVASSLSLWIAGEERPAAFASGAQVAAAYDSVVSKARDPALLQELSPGLLRLLLFPLSRNARPMRVRIGITVPLRWTAGKAWLFLPQVVDHNCGHGRIARHELVFSGNDAPPSVRVDDEAMARPIAVRRGAMTVQARDAEGTVVQRMVPRVVQPATEPVLVVMEASASVGQALADPAALLAAFPEGVASVVFVAHGNEWQRLEAAFGSPRLVSFVRAQKFTGGVDARPALQAAIDEAVHRGAPRVYWWHGAAAALHQQAWPTFVPEVQVVAFAVHPGRNVLREKLPASAGIVDVPRFAGGDEQLVGSLAEFVRFWAPGTAADIGDHARQYERRSQPAADVAIGSDQIARLWAARTAREQLRHGEGPQAAALAARYRVVTAGAGAVVLESREQYEAHKLDPGAAIGREPVGPVGGGPVPELSTWFMVATGLLAVLLCQRRRAPSSTPR